MYYFFVFQVLGLTKFVRPNNGSSPSLQPILDRWIGSRSTYSAPTLPVLLDICQLSPASTLVKAESDSGPKLAWHSRVFNKLIFFKVDNSFQNNLSF